MGVEDDQCNITSGIIKGIGEFCFCMCLTVTHCPRWAWSILGALYKLLDLIGLLSILVALSRQVARATAMMNTSQHLPNN